MTECGDKGDGITRRDFLDVGRTPQMACRRAPRTRRRRRGWTATRRCCGCWSTGWNPSLYGPRANQPQVRGRTPLKNVSIANSDSAAFAYTHSAINEGYRAVQDLPG
jgi:hypothetical protein